MQSESFFDYTNIIDSHFHTLSVNERNGETVFDIPGIDIGTQADDLPIRIKFNENNRNLLFSAAMGPWETLNRSKDEIDKLFELLIKNIDIYKPSFIGECGLDYHYMYNTPEIQIYLFEKHMKIAKSMNKKVLIHNRESDTDSIKVIRNNPDVKGLIHCFSGDPDLMHTALEHGYYISFAGNLTYKANQNLRDMLVKCPKDRILLETDSPYLAPVPKRGQTNTPALIVYTYQCASECLGMSFNDLAALINTNFRAFAAL